MSEKIPISRVTLSGRLNAIMVPEDGSDRALFYKLCRLLAGQGINMAFAAMRATCQGAAGLCCIAAKDQARAEAVLGGDQALASVLDFLPDKALVGLFPHQHRLDVLGKALQAFGSGNIRVYSLASSISALTFVIDFDRAAHAIRALGRFFQLPPDHETPAG